MQVAGMNAFQFYVSCHKCGCSFTNLGWQVMSTDRFLWGPIGVPTGILRIPVKAHTKKIKDGLILEGESLKNSTPWPISFHSYVQRVTPHCIASSSLHPWFYQGLFCGNLALFRKQMRGLWWGQVPHLLHNHTRVRGRLINSHVPLCMILDA